LGPNGLVQETHDILAVAASFYKNLFRKENRRGASLEVEFWDEANRVSSDERLEIEKPFSVAEMRMSLVVMLRAPQAQMGSLSSSIRSFGILLRGT
jgi:hypothetical protein